MINPMFHVIKTALPGCMELLPRRLEDERGCFVKVFHRDTFSRLGFAADFPEEYYSTSRRHVIRGLHFQTPPAQHAKLVFCTYGRVLDVAVDLRAGSPSFGQHVALELSATKANMLYLPEGVAHGFCVLSDQATMIYKVSSQYSPENDKGILWSSAGIEWPTTNPILSQRDRSHPRLDEFETPFRFLDHGGET